MNPETLGVEMKRQSMMPLALLLTIASGCQNETDPGDSDDIVTPPPTQQPANLPRTTTDGLVQILVYGLAAWEFDPSMQQYPTAIKVHLPPATGHTKDLYRGDDATGWTKVDRDENNQIIVIDGKTITFDANNTLEAHRANESIGAYPTTPEQATSVKWLFPANRFETIHGFDPSYADTHLVFDKGYLETCGLVHDPTNEKVCQVEANGNQQSASEYMVVRYAVDQTVQNVPVYIQDDINTQTARIPYTTSGGPITWQGKVYSRFFDIRIRNTTVGSTRDMESTHANYLKPLFPGTTSSWDLFSPDCTWTGSAWDCSACPEDTNEIPPRKLQPPCLRYFADKYGSPGGANRTICPFVVKP